MLNILKPKPIEIDYTKIWNNFKEVRDVYEDLELVGNGYFLKVNWKKK